MGVAVYVRRGQELVATQPVTGQRGAREVWLPAIARLELELLDVAFTGGLTVTEAYYAQFLGEVRRLIEALDEGGVDQSGHQARARGLLRVLEEHPPTRGCVVYVG